MRRYTIFSDGSCPKPHGPGGWASVCLEDAQLTVVGNTASTTNNRMELLAVVEGLLALPEGSMVTVVSDSQYVVFGYTKWLQNWVSSKARWERTKNRDLWEDMILAVKRHKSVAFRHVKGHNGNPNNEWADKLAGKQTELAKELLLNEQVVLS